MSRSDKPIRLSGHAKDQAETRGAVEAEAVEASRTEPWQPAELGRLECRHDLVFDAEWNRHHYQTKQIRPIFVEEAAEIVVVTVYVYCF